MPTLSDSDSAPELSDKVVSLSAGIDDDESPAEEQNGRRGADDDDGEEEEEEEVVVEAEEEEADRESNGGEEVDEASESYEEVVEEEEVEEEEEEEEEGDGREERADLSAGEDKDTSMKIEPEEHGEGVKSVLCTPERSNSKSTITHAKDGSGDHLTAYDPSDSVAQLEKETSTEASKGSQEAHGSYPSHLALGDPMGGENIRSLQVQENELAAENKNVKSDSFVESPHRHTKTNLQTPENTSLSSMRTPQRRPRSSSPGATVSNAKKGATICDFFARGWCIRGNSCKFIHQKEGVFNTTLHMVEDQSAPSRKEDYFESTGSKEDERLQLSASQELLDSSNTESSSKSLLLHRALVRAYGEERPGLPQIHDEYNMHGEQSTGREFIKVDVPRSGWASNPPVDEFRQTMVREEYKRPFGVSPHFGSADERQSGSDDFLPRRYLNEGKLLPEMPRGDSLNVSPFSRGSPLSKNTLVPEYIYYSGASSAASSLFQNSNNPLSYDRRTGHAFAKAGTSSIRVSTPFSAEHLETHKTSDFDGGNYGSRSASLPRNSSPFYSRTEVENPTQHSIPRASSGQNTQAQNAWEPSVPFQSSFCSAPANTSSPGSQYDPLLDSIEPPKAGNITFQTSQRSIIHNVSSQAVNGDPILSGSHTPGYISLKPLNLFSHSHEGIMGKNTSSHGLSGYNAVVASPGLTTVDVGKSSMPKEEKHLNSGHVVDGANIYESDPTANLRSQEDKGRSNKESKAQKFFRSALVDFLKELVKPSWREGHLSKDAHKMIVKKAVEKVLGAMQPHQVPSTTESVNQYLSTSRPKLLKLVEGYVDKYAKS